MRGRYATLSLLPVTLWWTGCGRLGPMLARETLRPRVDDSAIHDPSSPASGADCWTTLAALATSTHTIRLGPLVNCVYYRHPVVLARMAADVDQLSDGRLVLGLGIGDNEQEFDRLGIPLPPA